jgi:hypothetical protein
VEDKKANRLRLIAEELVLHVIAPQFGACELTVSFPESRDAYRVSVTYPGEDKDALETGDELSVALVRNAAKSIERAYDKESGVNAFNIEV